jgi:UDP-glucose 4-epimerase
MGMPVRPHSPARIAITGSSGLYGRAIIRELRRSLPAAVVLGIDRLADDRQPPDEFWQGDIRSAGMVEAVRHFGADTVVHLAYAVQPGRDGREMRETNIDGTRRILAAAAACDAARVLVASSATVYGAWPDNPPCCDESTPLRPRPDYYYSEHKGHVERLVAEFADEHPRIAVSWTRPTIICGPGVKNFLSDFFLNMPFLLLPDGADTPLQFVHEEDLARATLAILSQGARGPFNVAPDDALTHRQIARLLGVPAFPMPFFVMNGIGRVWWTLRLPWLSTPPGLAHYVRHPWVMTSERLKRELGFEFAYSSSQAFRSLLRQPDRPVKVKPDRIRTAS